MQRFTPIKHLYTRINNLTIMNSIKKVLFYTISCLLVLGLASCKKDDTLRYNNITMGNLVNGKFISDQGNTFNMVEMNSTVDLKKFKRGIMSCDVLREVGEKEYDVRVNYMDTVFTKTPILASVAAEDPEKTVSDPIHIEQLWVSGGYINMYIVFEIQINPMLENSKHMINLVLDDSKKESGKYSFRLRHNSFGETFVQLDTENTVPEVTTQADSQINWGFAGSYVTFPISEIIKDQTAEITLNWTSHIITEFAWSAKTEEKSYKISYSKDYFEHAPLTIKSKTSVPVK